MTLDFLKTIVRRFQPSAKGHGDFRRKSRYSVSITNLSSLQTVAEWRTRRWRMVLAGIAAALLIGMVAIAMVNMTPLRHVLPATMPTALRDDFEEMNQRLDSIQRVYDQSMAFMLNMNAILNPADSVSAAPLGEAVTLPLDSLMEASAAERAYVQRFEDKDRYNLSVLAPIAATGMTFYPPVLGVTPEEGVSDSGIPFLRFNGLAGVSAAYRGTVINSYYTSEKGMTVSVQHPNDFITIYSGLSNAFVGRGDKVNAGMRIGENRDASRPIIFEIWHNGTPLQGAEYISF